MRKLFAAVAAVALLAMVVVSMSYGGTRNPAIQIDGPAPRPPTASCTSSGYYGNPQTDRLATIDAKGIMVVSPVVCTTIIKQKTGAKKYKVVRILAKVTKVTYVARDQDGNTCGSPVTKINTGRFASLPLGPASVSVWVTIAPRNSKFRQYGQKIYKGIAKITSSKYSAKCTNPKLVKADPPGVLCSDAKADFSDSCGQPVLPDGRPGLPGACRWAELPTSSGSGFIVSAGQWFCGDTQNSCWLTAGNSGTWLGSPIEGARGHCSDGTLVEYFLRSVTLTSAASSCGPFFPRIKNISSFKVPSNWGGATLRVVWYIESLSAKGVTLGYQNVAKDFVLTGSDNGCLQLQSDPMSIYWPEG